MTYLQMSFHRNRKYLLCSVSAMVFLVLVSAGAANAFQNDEEEHDGIYRGLPGLVTVWSDGKQKITQREGRLAFFLEKNESPHPQISADAFQGTYTGTLNIKRPGIHRFSVELIGEFSLVVNGKNILDAESVGTQAKTKTSEPIDLKYGPATIEATFRKAKSGRAVLRLFWQRGEEFRQPVSANVLFHDARHETESFKLWNDVERGRKIVSDHNCIACHQATSAELHAASLEPAGAPRLDQAGARMYRNWIFHWLNNPHAFRTNTTMPKLFGDSEADRIDLYAVTEYLSSLGGPLKEAKSAPNIQSDDLSSIKGATTSRRIELAGQGKRAFAETGCIACHTALGESHTQSSQLRSLAGLGSKTTPQGIASAILKPWEHHPASRMPDFRLGEESPELLQNIVSYLNSNRNKQFEAPPAEPDRKSMSNRLRDLITVAKEQATFATLDVKAQWRELGKIVVERRGCLNCHTLGEKKTTRASLSTFSEMRRRTQSRKSGNLGCLEEHPSAGVPRFDFSKQERQAIFSFLLRGITQNSGVSAPIYEARRSLRRRGCTACHQYNGTESIFARRILKFAKLGSDQQLRDVTPPELTAVGEKLQPDWIHAVVSQGKRARGWMKLKMPVFPQKRVENLSRQLIAADGCSAEAPNVPPALVTEEELEVGRMLVGKTGFNCVSCHDIRGIQSSGVRGPDLAGVSQRVHREWFGRWMLDPQQISPGTRMPNVFFAGRSAAPQYLNGNPQAQMDAVWAYLSQGEKLKLPFMTTPLTAPIAGGENPKLIPKDRPVLARGFLREHGGHRGIALGFPQGTHFGFDSQTCQIVSAWQGDFLELGGWYGFGRGGAEKDFHKVLGDVFWKNTTQSFISFGRVKKPNVRFLACWGTKNDAGFSYRVESIDGMWMTVEDRPAPLPDLKIPGFRRTITLTEIPATQTVRLSILEQADKTDSTPEDISPPNSSRLWWRVPRQGKPSLVSVLRSSNWTTHVTPAGIQLSLNSAQRRKSVSVSIIYLQPASDRPVDISELEKTLND